MRTKKIIALTMVALFALILVVPIASNATAPSPLTPAATAFILPQQDNTPQPKAIPTNPLGPDNLTDGEMLVYDGFLANFICFPHTYMESGPVGADYDFEYNYTRWGDWFIALLLGFGPIPSIAINNQTREIGLNGTEPFWSGVPDNESVITLHKGVYSFIAIPTGVKAGDHVKIMTPIYYPFSDSPWQQITFEVLGRTTTPILPDMMEFYDTWVLHGTFTNASISMAFEFSFDTETGLLVSGTVGLSDFYFEDSMSELGGWFSMVWYTSEPMLPGSPAELPDAGIDYLETAEEGPLLYETFTYNESGYWWMDMSVFNASWPTKVKLNSLDYSTLNFFLQSLDSFDLIFGISQNVSIPDNWWEINDPGWNPAYYDNDTRTGYIEYWDYWSEFEELTRLDSYFGALWSMFLAPTWIRDGSVLAVEMPLPMFWPDPDFPDFGPPVYEGFYWPVLPFRVSGAVPVVIDGNVYDCWKAELVVPTDLSDVNLTQFQVELYYERTSGILIKAKADMEGKIPERVGWMSFGYHKTWTLAESGMIPLSKAVPTPEDLNQYHNNYTGYFYPNETYTLDPSFFNGGSVTVNCSDLLGLTMWTTTQLAGNVSIGGKPIVKFMQVEPQILLPLARNGETYYTATVNFYYTASELWAMGAKESGFTVYAWNDTAMAWEPLNTTWDAEGRVVSANTTHFSLFALVASELTIWDILGPVGSLTLLNLLLGQAAGPPLGGLLLPLAGLGIGFLILALIALGVLRKPE